LIGQNIYIRSLELNDANGSYPGWLNDPVVCKYNSHGDIFNTKKMTIDYIKMVNNSHSYKVFAICDKQTNKHIGNISLQDISQKNKSAEFAILIGERDFMGIGVGKEAGEILLKYAFNVLKLHRIYCGTSEHNIPMQKLALHLKMQLENITAKIINKKHIDFFNYGIVVKNYFH